MCLARDPRGLGCRERLARIQQQRKGQTNMSARARAARSLEPAAEQIVTANREVLAGRSYVSEDVD